MNFAKLNVNIGTVKFADTNLQTYYGHEQPFGFVGIRYYRIATNSLAPFYQVIPNRYRNDFILLHMFITTPGNITAHTDTGIKCCINFYQKTNNELTQFYDLPDREVTTSQMVNQVDGKLFNASELIETDSFAAIDNSCYLLNVAVPHAVINRSGTNNYGSRSALSLQTAKHSFSDVLSMIQETGFLE